MRIAGTDFTESSSESSSVPPRFSGRELVCVRGERSVFARLSFALNPGGALLLVGPNGSGKSSLLRLLAGLSPPAAGALFRNGQRIGEDMEAHMAMIRYVGHLDAVKPALPVAESVMFWGGLVGLDRRGACAAAVTAMTRFGIDRFADWPGRLLSAGQKRRVNLARLLLGTSDVWLLDEPTTALDQASVAVLGAVVAEHRDRGGMVVLSTHTGVDLPGAERLDMRDFTVDPLAEIRARPVDGAVP